MTSQGKPIRRRARIERLVSADGNTVDRVIDEHAVTFDPASGAIHELEIAVEGFACGCSRHGRLPKFRCSCGALVCADCPVAGYSESHEPLCGACSRIIDTPDRGPIRVSVDEHESWRWHKAIALVLKALLAPFVRREGPR